MDKNTRLQRNNDMVSAKMGEDTVMMNETTGKYYNLGTTGGAIWELLEEPLTLQELIAKLTEAFEVEATACEADTVPFLEDLIKNNLVSVVQ